MYLTLSKRFELSSSHRLYVRGWSPAKNMEYFGRESLSEHGHGHNFTASFVFTGEVDQRDGMLINVSSVKRKIKERLYPRYDHRFLNEDTPPFDEVNPTPENISRHLLRESQELFRDDRAHPVICHLIESPRSEATAYADGRVERHLWLDFSAARVTVSPHLSDEENKALFGIAASPSGHGHHYKLRVTLSGDLDEESGMIFPEKGAWKVLRDAHQRFDHKNLNQDVPELEGMPMTTEMLARHFYRALSAELPVARVRLYEHDRFFVDCCDNASAGMGLVHDFHAAHRLHSPLLSDQQNEDVYGVCNNPRGHGHLYTVETTIAGEIDEKTGALTDLKKLAEEIEGVLDSWNYKHLNLDTDDFEGRPTTGENITHVLWNKLDGNVYDHIHRLRLWETPNNRFTLRRQKI